MVCRSKAPPEIRGSTGRHEGPARRSFFYFLRIPYNKQTPRGETEETGLEKNERQEEQKLPIRNDSQIQLIVNQPDTDEVTIDLGRVFHNMKLKSRIYAWLLVLCMLVGACAPLLLYQFTKSPLTVTSVVTLRYLIENPELKEPVKDGETKNLAEIPKEIMVNQLIAPDNTEINLNQITASSVLQEALDGLSLSKPVTLENIRNNLTITRVLTDESARTKEILEGMADNKSADLYKQLQDAEMKYQNRFLVSLSNGFGNEESRVKYDLTAEELRTLLDRILEAYNRYLVETYADVKLPENRIALIDTENLDVAESLDLLSKALQDLYNYCDGRQDSVKSYRSWRTGRSLADWMEVIRSVQEVSVKGLEVQLYSKGLITAREEMLANYQYELRTLQQRLEQVNGTIAETDRVLKSYKNDNVIVSMQESDSTRSTQVTTAYYNEMVLKQADAYKEAEKLRVEIDGIRDKMADLSAVEGFSDSTGAESGFATVLEISKAVYREVRAHMEEVVESPLFTTYAEHSAPQGKELNFLQANLKKILIGLVVGAVLACGIWFLAALAPEFRRNREEEKPQMAEEGEDK